jgi:hypothetical protein
VQGWTKSMTKFMLVAIYAIAASIFLYAYLVPH